MPMIDVTATEGHICRSAWTRQGGRRGCHEHRAGSGHPNVSQNTAGFVHEIPAGMLADVDGSDAHVRVQVLTNAGALDRDKQLTVVAELTRLVAEAAGDPDMAYRTWVLLTEAPNGGWGLHGHPHTNSELVAAARAEIAGLSVRDA